MPLRNHFRKVISKRECWEAVFAQWMGEILRLTNVHLAPDFFAIPRIELASAHDLDRQSEYEVLVYDADEGERLVAAIELVSPSNKDRPEHRRAFVSKCVGLLWNEVSLVIVDPVTTRSPNLFHEVWEEVGGPTPKAGPVATLAVSIRPTVTNGKLKVVTWEHALAIGLPLPTLPLWLNESRSIPLDLEASYEETCGTLRIGR